MEVPVMRALHCGMENYDMVGEQKRVGHEDGSGEREKMETQIRVSQQRSAVAHPYVKVGGRGEGTGYRLWCDEG